MELNGVEGEHSSSGLWQWRCGSATQAVRKGTWAGSCQEGVMLRLLREPRKRAGQSKQPLPTTQATTLHMDLTRRLLPKSS